MLERASEQILVRDDFIEYFPVTEFGGYEAFAAIRGNVLKRERRTRVVRLRREGGARGSEQERWFVFKEYRYPWLPRFRTWLRISKAENEFNSLRQVRELGLPCAEAVAWGVKRTALGLVRSCFIVTSFVENSVTLSEYAIKDRSHGAADERRTICNILGRNLRRLHEARLFLFTAKPKNILLRRGKAGTELFFIDLPYARFLRWQPLARWAQAKDLAMMLANYLPRLPDNEVRPFYEAYLPDPLGNCDDSVRKRVERAVRVRLNQTLLSAFVHRLRRGARQVRASLNSNAERA
jgi:tRNA A-37 threonylcarbamoyl transferase component Bud32